MVNGASLFFNDVFYSMMMCLNLMMMCFNLMMMCFNLMMRFYLIL